MDVTPPPPGEGRGGPSGRWLKSFTGSCGSWASALGGSGKLRHNSLLFFVVVVVFLKPINAVMLEESGSLTETAVAAAPRVSTQRDGT